MKDNKILAGSIFNAVEEIESGLVHANLGGGVYKQRVARAGEGKSGGFRTILIFKKELRAIFLRGFAKNERENLTPQELKYLKDLAKEMLLYDQKTIDRAVAQDILEEVIREEPLLQPRTPHSA